MKEQVFGVILAGGIGRRMGGSADAPIDKSLLQLGEMRLIEHVAARLRPQVAELALNANGDPARFADLGLAILPDPVPDYPGPLAGVLAGMVAGAAQGYRYLLTAATDTPFFPQDLAQRLVTAAAKAPADSIIMAAGRDASGARRRHPVFALWPVHLHARLRADMARGEAKVARWADAQGCLVEIFEGPSGADPFFNINSPEDLARAALPPWTKAHG